MADDIMTDKVPFAIISESVDEAKFNKTTDDLSLRLQSIKTEIAQHEAQLATLKKQEKAIEGHLGDIAQLQTIFSRMKIRETEGIK